ncbi:ARM repeat-containing protein [Glarea lozoyensis ATCC 20868]|uniref:ARM repeat-containing protein n=1 Tax=Glarea lozoyensis (strain ATCC 20868 / MF5171) TaxID=1116229 RepID=S3CKM2_GLAL2|nr:ARM repeat-containing protein [Glarea lozoyensis ATCC 20868]EPE25749.1 ARM repeat-containing protein [Glarea lozoyensis ATCC 20868]
MFTIASTPAKQSVTETISTLASRLSSSTLLEDRRAAILGLRSFAKDYPASVASDALRGLITSLTKDGEDVDTVKVVLETLLMLFNPNENSPEASEEIALWLADEFTQRQDNITLLLDFLETNDFYSRLYSLQLLSAILASRTERTEECIFTAPLGISRLVAVLDDRREAVRNEALALLTYLTPSSSELQKVVAFENVFDRIFSIIKLEGSISEGDRVVEDCLILLANLLRLNVSNQSFFRETGCVPKLAQLLSNSLGGDTTGEVAEWAMLQKNRNTFALLAVLRLFLVTGGHGTPANQASFWQHGILALVLQIAFSRNTEMQIKAEALITCADLIRANSRLQEGFAQLQVTSVLDEPPLEGTEAAPQNGIPKVYVIDGLLDLTLSVPTPAAFDSRMAACECIKAYFYNHPAIRKHFLRRAIDGHKTGADETANVLTTLLQPMDSQVSSDPYRYWFAAVILFHLIHEDGDAKSLAMSLTEGDASSGEEVVTCIQTITENLIIGIQKNVDERVLVAYLMLLSGWLYEDPDGVNDFLGEGSNIQSLVQAVVNPGPGGVLVPGLAAVLLGTIYEFSTKDSPVPRATIHPILASRMGRDLYVDRITKLRGHPLLRDFEVLPQKLSSAPQGGFPEVFFDRTFVEFIKDNFGRILRAIDRDPGMEIPIISNGVQKGISREMVDSLRSQLEQKSKALEKAEEDLLVVGRQLGQEQADHRRARETSTVELSRIKQVNEALQRHHEEDLNKIREEQNRVVQDLQRQLDSTKKTNEANAERVAQDHQRQLDHVQKTTEANAARTRKRAEAEVSDLQKSLSKLEADLEKANKNHLQDLKTAHDEYMTKQTEQAARLKRAEEKLAEANERAEAARIKAEKSETAALERAKEKQAIQSELDDLLMVFGDLEDKVTKYKNRLKEAGGNVTDEEDDDEEEEDEDGDGDEEEDID